MSGYGCCEEGDGTLLGQNRVPSARGQTHRCSRGTVTASLSTAFPLHHPGPVHPCLAAAACPSRAPVAVCPCPVAAAACPCRVREVVCPSRVAAVVCPYLAAVAYPCLAPGVKSPSRVVAAASPSHAPKAVRPSPVAAAACPCLAPAPSFQHRPPAPRLRHCFRSLGPRRPWSPPQAGMQWPLSRQLCVLSSITPVFQLNSPHHPACDMPANVDVGSDCRNRNLCQCWPCFLVRESVAGRHMSHGRSIRTTLPSMP